MRAGPRVAVVIAVAVAVASVLVGARIAIKALARGVRTTRNTVRFAFRAATLRLYLRCPDCRRFVRYDARVCYRCGYRKRVR